MKCPPAPTHQDMYAPCPRCGATTEEQAGDICRPGQDETGEATCPGSFDRDGNSIQPSTAYIAALDAWIGEHCGCGNECCAQSANKGTE